MSGKLFPKFMRQCFFFSLLLSDTRNSTLCGTNCKQRRWRSPQASGIWCIAIFEVSPAAPACSDNCSERDYDEDWGICGYQAHSQTTNTVVTEASTAHAIHAHTYITFYYGKAIPLQACTGPEGSSRSRLPDFKVHRRLGYDALQYLRCLPPHPSVLITVVSEIMTKIGELADTRPVATPRTQWLQRLPLRMQYTHIRI